MTIYKSQWAICDLFLDPSLDWLDSVLRRFGNISAISRRALDEVRFDQGLSSDQMLNHVYCREQRITKFHNYVFDLSLIKGIYLIEIIQRDVLLYAIHGIIEHTDGMKSIIWQSNKHLTYYEKVFVDGTRLFSFFPISKGMYIIVRKPIDIIMIGYICNINWIKIMILNHSEWRTWKWNYPFYLKKNILQRVNVFYRKWEYFWII